MNFLKQKQINVFNVEELPIGHYARIKYRIKNSIDDWRTYNANVIITSVSEERLQVRVICEDVGNYLHFYSDDTSEKELISLDLIKFVHMNGEEL